MANRTLHETTPPMFGPDVRRLQEALDKNPHFGDLLRGSAVDGEFGTYTGQAVYRAKYWLGYAKPNKYAGIGLVRFLEGKKPLNDAMKERRNRRLKKRAQRPLRLKALDRMESFIGMKENPAGSNVCAISKWYGLIGPWCCMGVSKAYDDKGSNAFVRGSRFASCSVIAYNAKLGNHGLSVTKDPKPGDLVLMRWPGSKYDYDHIEMVTDAYPLKTIGCNTSPDKGGSQANGGMCCRKDREDERKAGIIKLYIHVSN